MIESAQGLIDWIAAHPTQSLVLLFCVALLDALFLLGAFVPAAVVLFAVGALVALGSLGLWQAALIAAAGALAGDTLSFAVGRRYGDALFESRWFRRYPDLLNRGRVFFAVHGGKGVMLARFLGPVRSITPAMAGASGMPAWLFVLVDAPAALAWAFVYLLPGVLFGASLSLAAEVASRLAGLLVLVIGLLILGFWLVRTGLNLFNLHAARWINGLLEWSRRHRRLGRFGPGLADPTQPETPALVAVALLLLACGLAWLFTFGGAGWRLIPGTLDALVQQTLHDLNTPWGTAIAHYVARLGQWPVYGTTALAVFAVLLWRRRLRAAAHWIAALLFALAVTLLLEGLPLVPPPATYFDYLAVAPPLRDLAMPAVIYGFAATLYATLRPPSVRLFAYGLAITVILLVAMARLLLGQEWISLNSFAVVMALLWIFALTLGYRQHRPERLFGLGFGVPVLAAFGVAAALSWGVDRAVSRLPAAPAEETREMSLSQWWQGGWRRLPSARMDMRGQALRSFDLQWAGRADDVEAALLGAGWTAVPPMQPADALRWLTQSTRIDELPVLPQVHAGRHAGLTYRRVQDDDRQQLLRLWASGVHVDSGERDMPVWLGLQSRQRARTVWRLLRYPVTEREPVLLPPLTASDARTRLEQVYRAGQPLWLIGVRTSHYTAPVPDAPAGAPVPLP